MANLAKLAIDFLQGSVVTQTELGELYPLVVNFL